MPEDDELERLRRADPVAEGSLPSADSPRARALFEEITMTDLVSDRPRLGSPRQRWIAGIAAAALLVGGGAAATALLGDRQLQEVTAEPSPEPSQEPITPGGGMTASCVEFYNLSTLTNREMAFDGTVERVEGDSVTFSVSRAYRGVEPGSVTLKGASTLAGVTSAGDGTSLDPGMRLLVAGDGGFAWGCGFTQQYDPSVAAEWERTFGG